ncbi:MAG TPA: hypothetical protein VEX60_16150 [Pyrinomonadaceae bacterium]|nr:hypothetical protein [Pyrinomonadaceae bacterium]
MNCQDFESNINALARGALMDARERETALAHESACTRCAARLADERALTSGLRVLAADTKDMEAPARVEAALLAAFRARAASRVGVAPLADETIDRPWSWMRTVAVASLAAAAALALFMLIPPIATKTNVAVTGNQTTGQEQVAATTGTIETATQKDKQTLSSSVAAASSTPLPVADENVLRASVPRRQPNRPVQGMNAGLSRSDVRGSQTQRGLAQTASSSSEEVTTDFIPLMQGERFTQGEGGHLVRIELPRSALERFGLPINAERAGGRVKADVLLGEDGLARAIRFVR